MMTGTVVSGAPVAAATTTREHHAFVGTVRWSNVVSPYIWRWRLMLLLLLLWLWLVLKLWGAAGVEAGDPAAPTEAGDTADGASHAGDHSPWPLPRSSGPPDWPRRSWAGEGGTWRRPGSRAGRNPPLPSLDSPS
jgi:hypothetical protein